MNRVPHFSSVFTIGSRRTMRGLTVIQLIGCVAAIVAGVIVGAMFLDIDLKAAWQLGLENAGVASPQEKAPQGDAAPSGPGSSTGAQPESPANLTLAYWNFLREIIREEQASRTLDETLAGGDARAILYAQSKAFRQATDAIRSLTTDDVDPEATALAEDLAAWYERTADLSDEGTRLDEGDLAASNGPLGRRWHSAQKQQGEQLDLLTRKITSIQGKLSARYRKAFPNLR